MARSSWLPLGFRRRRETREEKKARLAKAIPLPRLAWSDPAAGPLTLVQFRPAWAIQAYLRFAGIPYRVENSRFDDNATSSAYPQLLDGHFVLPAHVIFDHLQTSRPSAQDGNLDAHLSAAERADSKAFSALVEEKLDPLLRALRWRVGLTGAAAATPSEWQQRQALGERWGGHEALQRAETERMQTVLPQLKAVLPFPLSWIRPKLLLWGAHRRSADRHLSHLPTADLLAAAEECYAALDVRLETTRGHDGEGDENGQEGEEEEEEEEEEEKEEESGRQGGDQGAEAGREEELAGAEAAETTGMPPGEAVGSNRGSRSSGPGAGRGRRRKREEGGAGDGSGWAGAQTPDYFFGSRPTRLDAVVFGHVAEAMCDTHLLALLPQYTNVTRHFRLICARYFDVSDLSHGLEKMEAYLAQHAVLPDQQRGSTMASGGGGATGTGGGGGGGYTKGEEEEEEESSVVPFSAEVVLREANSTNELNLLNQLHATAICSGSAEDMAMAGSSRSRGGPRGGQEQEEEGGGGGGGGGVDRQGRKFLWTGLPTLRAVAKAADKAAREDGAGAARRHGAGGAAAAGQQHGEDGSQRSGEEAAKKAMREQVEKRERRNNAIWLGLVGGACAIVVSKMVSDAGNPQGVRPRLTAL